MRKKNCIYYRAQLQQFSTLWISSDGSNGNENSKLHILSLLSPARYYLASQSSPMLVHILMLLEKADDVRQSLPVLLICYSLLPCENQKLPDIAKQHFLELHSQKGLECQHVTGHENLFTQDNTALLHLAQITRVTSLKPALF